MCKHVVTMLICFIFREQERELLFQKKGKRPRGRPRKILVPSQYLARLISRADFKKVLNRFCCVLSACTSGHEGQPLVFLRSLVFGVLVFIRG